MPTAHNDTSRSGSPSLGRPPPVTSANACSLAGANIARGRRPLPIRGGNPGGVTEANRKNQHGDPSTPARSAGDECRRPTAEFDRRLRHGTWQPNIWDQIDIESSMRQGFSWRSLSVFGLSRCGAVGGHDRGGPHAGGGQASDQVTPSAREDGPGGVDRSLVAQSPFGDASRFLGSDPTRMVVVR